MRIKLMADYECFCLWWDREPGRVGPIEPDELALSEALKAELWAWSGLYDSTLDRDDPIQSGFASPAEAIAFRDRGAELLERLKAELGPDVQVRYQP